MPTVLEDDIGPASIAMIRALVTQGALALTSAGQGVDELIETGVAALVHKGTSRYEDQWGERLQVTVGSSVSFSCGAGGDAHACKLRLRPIAERLQPRELWDFCLALNDSIVQGPWMWAKIIGFASDSSRSAAEEEDRAVRDHSRAGDALRAEAAKQAAKHDTWLANLVTKWPELLANKDAPLPAQTKRRRLKPDAGLRNLIAEFVAKTTATAAQQIYGSGAIIVTSWDNNCYINHAHDCFCEMLHNGEWDWPEDVSFFSRDDTVPEFAQHMNLMGEALIAITNLEEWTNAHC